MRHMTDAELFAHPGWKWCTFEGARNQVLAIGLTTSFREKLEWLEGAEEVSLRFRAGKTLTPNSPTPDPSVLNSEG